MGKNSKIKKIGYLGSYSFVLFLYAFDCLYFWVSHKQQVVHYNKLTECFYGKHVTYLSGVYLWAYIFFIMMPVVFFIFWKKKIRTVALCALLFILHVAVGTSVVIWLESKQHNIIYVQTGYNTLKQVRKYKFGSDGYEVSWKNDRVQIFQELWDEDKPNHSPYIDIYYDEWKKAGADTD